LDDFVMVKQCLCQ